MTVLTKNQKSVFPWREYTEDRHTYRIRATVRYDDDCNNGHNTFSITGEIQCSERGRWREFSGGCLHKEVAQHFPTLAPFIKWHLCSSNGPMHYIANTVYQASDKDHNGHSAGDPIVFQYGVQFDKVPITHPLEREFWEWLMSRAGSGDFQIVPIAHNNGSTFAPNYTFVGFAEKWHECPFSNLTIAEQMRQAFNKYEAHFVKEAIAWSEGKPRDLDAARNSAIWPEATDKELTAPGLRERLVARLPALMKEFQNAMESLAFTY